MRDVADQFATLAIAVLKPLELLRDALAHGTHGAAKHADLVAGFDVRSRTGVLAERLQFIGEFAQRPG